MHALVFLFKPILLLSAITLVASGLTITSDSYVSMLNITTNENHNRTSYQQLPPKVTLTNSTHNGDEDWIIFHVPNTPTTLRFLLGFSLNKAALMSTINAALDYAKIHVQSGDRGPLPREVDPFIEDLGYGAIIHVVSVRPHMRMTWQMLQDAMQGLWDFLVVDGRSFEAEFDLMWMEPNAKEMHLGRGSIEASSYRPDLSASSISYSKRRPNWK